MMADLKADLLEEIALEGLDGITINGLWVRLKETPNFPLTLDEGSRSYIWRCILGLRDVQFYRLPEPRPDLVAYNRLHYIDPDTRHFIATDAQSVDVYPICVINDNGIMGSCSTYTTRVNVSGDVRKPGAQLTLAAAIEMYGQTLVIVASQELRLRTLIGTENDPNFTFNMSNYTILERIGRARYSGEASVGTNSLHDLGEGTKSIYYHIKKLRPLKVFKSQQLVMVRHNPYIKISCRLYHLNRFYKLIGNPWQKRQELLAEYIIDKPEQMDIAIKCKEYMKVSDKEFKKVTAIVNRNGQRYFQYVDVPYRHVYPNATPKQYMAKNHSKEKVIRHVKMLHNPADDADTLDFSDSDDNADDDEEDEPADSNFQLEFMPVYDRPHLMQCYQLIRRAGARGMSQIELKRTLKVDRLLARRYVKSLTRAELVKVVMKDRGRQKFMMYIAKDCATENELHRRVSQGMKKFDRHDKTAVKKKKPGPLPVTSPPTVKLSNEPMTEDRALQIKEELLNADPSVECPVKPRILVTDCGEYSVSVEEMKVNRTGNDKVGLQRFALTDVHIRRANWILEVVQATKMVEQFRCLKLIRNREESLITTYKMDSRSMQRLVTALLEERKIRSLITLQKMGTKEKQIHYLLDLDVSVDSEMVTRTIEQAKLKYFSVTKEDLLKAKKARVAAAASGDNSPMKEERYPALPDEKTLPDEIPESAKASIRMHWEYRRKLKNRVPPMVYNRRAGISYGLLPKMIRCEEASKYLFYLCSDMFGHELIPAQTKPKGAGQRGSPHEDAMDLHRVLSPADALRGNTNAKDALNVDELVWDEKVPPLYCDELSWKRFLPPLPVHRGYPRGWCLISDCLLNLPVRLFCQLVNVCYDIDGLHAILKHTDRRFYPIMHLPFRIAQQLLHSRKYITSFMEICSYLAEIGLLSFGSCKAKEKDQMFIYIHTKASLLDTRESLPGYNKTTKPDDAVFPRKSFVFTDSDSLQDYWQEMQIISLGSNLNCKSMAMKNSEDMETFEEFSIADAVTSVSPDTVVDDGRLPGDQRGGAGLDSRLFVHSAKNWCYDRQQTIHPNKYMYNKYNLSSRDVQPKSLATVKKPKVVGTPPEGGKKLVLSDGKGVKPVVIKKTRNMKGNPGGKGLKRQKTSINSGAFLRKRPSSMKYVELQPAKKIHYKKKPFEKGDDRDREIYAAKTHLRVQWTAKEDSVLLMCQIASCLMDHSRKYLIVKYTVVRDILHEKCPGVSDHKTSIACSRRLKFALKNPQTEQNVSLFLEEALQDKYILSEFASKSYVDTDAPTIQNFKLLVNYLLDKFQAMNIRRTELPDHMSDLADYTLESVGKLKPKKLYHDVESQVDICKDVLRNILHSSVLLQDKTGRNHEMFKLLTQYPDSLLSAVIRELRIDGLLVIQKQRSKRIDSKLHAGVGLRNFKVSQRYMYNFKHRYLSDMFDEGASLLGELCRAGRAGNQERVTLEFHPKGSQSLLLIPLLLQGVINFKVTMPEELVLVDMDGFYNFPWGRGKIGIRDSEKAAKDDQLAASEAQSRIDECFGSTLPPKPSQSVVAPETSTSESATHNAAGTPTHNAAGTPKDEPMEVDSGEMDKDSGIQDSDSAAILPDTGEPQGSESNDVGKSHKQGETGTVKRQETGAASSDHDTIIGENIDTSHKTEVQKEVIDTNDTKYNIYKHGSSEILMQEENLTALKELRPEQKVIASRTLVALRRVDETALDDIRIFNTQDNFVVNSCNIEINFRDEFLNILPSKAKTEKPLKEDVKRIDDIQAESGASRKPSEIVIISCDDDIEGIESALQDEVKRTEHSEHHIEWKEAGFDGEKTETMAGDDGEAAERQRHQKIMDELIVDKADMKAVWKRMQKTLPFQLDMVAVWQELAYEGILDSDIASIQRVYNVIDAAGDLGIKQVLLQKHFELGFPWRWAVEVLIDKDATPSATQVWQVPIMTRLLLHSGNWAHDEIIIEDKYCQINENESS